MKLDYTVYKLNLMGNENAHKKIPSKIAKESCHVQISSNYKFQIIAGPSQGGKVDYLMTLSQPPSI